MRRSGQEKERRFSVITMAIIAGIGAGLFLLLGGWHVPVTYRGTWFGLTFVAGCGIAFFMGRDIRHRLMMPAMLILILAALAIGGRAGASINGITTILHGSLAYFYGTLTLFVASLLAGDQLRGFVGSGRR